jgi:hypothetical protein
MLCILKNFELSDVENEIIDCSAIGVGLSTPLCILAQNVDIQPNKNQEAALANVPVTLVDINKAFITRAKMRVADNEKSLITMREMHGIKDPQAEAYYKENVALFEKRNIKMNNKMYIFNVVSGTVSAFTEFKKRWHWAMDELCVYEKNLMTENFLNK